MHHIEIVSQLEPKHLEQLPELLDAATRVDGHEPLGEHKFLRLQRGDDLAIALLAFDRGRLAGYAHALMYGEGDGRRASCEFVVHPEARRTGVGRALLAEAVAKARAQGARRLDLWAYNDSATSAHIAAKFGFAPARKLLHLHRHMHGAPAPRTVAGARIRAFRPGDDAALLELNNRIFAAHPEQGRWTLDDLHARMAQPWFDANDVLMLEVDGVLAGFCWLKVEAREGEGCVGEVYVIGTAPEHRGRGLGAYLMSAALSRLDARGADVAAIYVDASNHAAISLYEASGFHYHHVDVCYSVELPAENREPLAAVAA